MIYDLLDMQMIYKCFLLDMPYLTVRGGLLRFALKTRDGGVWGGVPWLKLFL
jgi:hypothetical protein